MIALSFIHITASSAAQACAQFGTATACTTTLPPSEPCGWCLSTHDGSPRCQACDTTSGCTWARSELSLCAVPTTNATLPPSPSPEPTGWIPNVYLQLEAADVENDEKHCGFADLTYADRANAEVGCFACHQWCSGDGADSIEARISSMLNTVSPGICSTPRFACANHTTLHGGTAKLKYTCDYDCKGIWTSLLKDPLWIAVIQAGAFAIVVTFVVCICAPICFVACVCVCCAGAVWCCIGSQRQRRSQKVALSAPALLSLDDPEEGTAGSRSLYEPLAEDALSGGSGGAGGAWADPDL